MTVVKEIIDLGSRAIETEDRSEMLLYGMLLAIVVLIWLIEMLVAMNAPEDDERHPQAADDSGTRISVSDGTDDGTDSAADTDA